MALKFFHIGKANTRIEELEVENGTLKEQAKTAGENVAVVSANAEKISAELTQVKADLDTASASIASLSARADKAERALKEAQDKLANPSAIIQEAASRKALDITAAQGQPPVVSSGSPIGSRDILAEHDAIKDPAERTAWYRKNKVAYDAAHKAKNPGDMKLGAATK